MKNCKSCGSNDWRFKTQGGMTVATCKNCKDELRWASHKKKKIKNGEPKVCECGAHKFTRIKKEITIEALKLPHYFTYYFVCSKCKAEYPDKSTKKNNLLY